MQTVLTFAVPRHFRDYYFCLPGETDGALAIPRAAPASSLTIEHGWNRQRSVGTGHVDGEFDDALDRLAVAVFRLEVPVADSVHSHCGQWPWAA